MREHVCKEGRWQLHALGKKVIFRTLYRKDQVVSDTLLDGAPSLASRLCLSHPQKARIFANFHSSAKLNETCVLIYRIEML
ncbi:hypothetical protein [Cohaesibacter haloalkalitolerans]|uniref:hypothetical protein n=1 Tax=Cohaesibacter haloalkalitolerans TaxID=1162980 RepID=UPI0013C4D645|nr:hypothetical protein [Cohaesibacter haloalkalitolerans]